MKRETIKAFIGQLDGMISALWQAGVLRKRNKTETEAYHLLIDARRRLAEDLEQREEREEMARQHQHEENERILRSPSSRPDDYVPSDDE